MFESPVALAASEFGVRRKKMIGIREEQPQDIEAITELNVLAFGQTQEADLADKLRQNCNDLLSLVWDMGTLLTRLNK